MGVTRFESVVSAQSIGVQDIERFASSIDKASQSLDALGEKAKKHNEHPGFDAFAEKVKKGIEDPLGSAAEGAEKLLKSLGPMGSAVAGTVGILSTAAVVGYEMAHSLGEIGTQ